VARWPFFGSFLTNGAILESHFQEIIYLAISCVHNSFLRSSLLVAIWLFCGYFAIFVVILIHFCRFLYVYFKKLNNLANFKIFFN